MTTLHTVAEWALSAYLIGTVSVAIFDWLVGTGSFKL